MAQPVLADASFPLASAAGTPGSLNIGRAIVRAFVQNFGKILAIWIVLTAALAYAINVQVKPLYETYSVLRVEPAPRDLFGLGRDAGEDTFLSTQIALITSSKVLNTALNNPRIASSPILAKVANPESEIRSRLAVGTIPGTYLIRIAMFSPDQNEPMVIVNEVVKVFLEESKTWNTRKNDYQLEKLRAYLADLENKIGEKKDKWLALAATANINLSQPSQGSSTGSNLPVAMPNKITVEHLRQVREQQFEVTMSLIEAESLLNERQAEIKARAQGVDPEHMLQKRIEEAFSKDPDVLPLLPKLESARHRERDLARKTRLPSDPSRVNAQRQLRELQDRLRELWEQKREDLTLQIRESGSGTTSEEISELSGQIASMKVRKNTYDSLLGQIGEESRQQETDAVKVAMIREDLTSLQGMRESVNKRVEQLQFDSQSDERVRKYEDAKTGVLALDSRKKYWMMTPVGVFAMVFGLFLLLELRSGRVADLDEVSRRVPVEVYALPSLPGTRRTSDQRTLRSNEAQLQEFLQGLDHLRVSLWYGKEPTAGVGRCLAITSAVGGEGKTTLASHLAVCCAKAGISTLVIDGDLRRAALSRMFEEEQNTGFSDVLKGDVSPESALIPLSDGGFHLLPAGRPGQHPGWLFREQRIVQVLEHYREMFDLVIIDTPPVLPVPDALSLGRWVDGAVLVIRYDLSRFDLVDRARRRLISAGIPILKTVVNGVKTSRFGSGYGSGYNYDYTYGNGDGERTPPTALPDSSSA